MLVEMLLYLLNTLILKYSYLLMEMFTVDSQFQYKAHSSAMKMVFEGRQNPTILIWSFDIFH